MLVLTLEAGEVVKIGDGADAMEVVFLDKTKKREGAKRVRIGFNGPRHINVQRQAAKCKTPPGSTDRDAAMDTIDRASLYRRVTYKLGAELCALLAADTPAEHAVLLECLDGWRTREEASRIIDAAAARKQSAAETADA